jgi:hypothetical protein
VRSTKVLRNSFRVHCLCHFPSYVQFYVIFCATAAALFVCLMYGLSSRCVRSWDTTSNMVHYCLLASCLDKVLKLHTFYYCHCVHTAVSRPTLYSLSSCYIFVPRLLTVETWTVTYKRRIQSTLPFKSYVWKYINGHFTYVEGRHFLCHR